MNLNGAVLSQSVYGGYAADGASDGTVNISVNSETGDLSTVSGSVYGGYSESGQAGGAVTITGGSVTGSVYGGRAEQGSAAAGTVTIGQTAMHPPQAVSPEMYTADGGRQALPPIRFFCGKAPASPAWFTEASFRLRVMLLATKFP